MTEKLFYEDAFLREFTGTVLDCREEKGQWAVVLDRTAFYPEGGGQPADHGTLGGAKVVDVREKDGEVLYNLLAAADNAVENLRLGRLRIGLVLERIVYHGGRFLLFGRTFEFFEGFGFHKQQSTFFEKGDKRWRDFLRKQKQKILQQNAIAADVFHKSTFLAWLYLKYL